MIFLIAMPRFVNRPFPGRLQNLVSYDFGHIQGIRYISVAPILLLVCLFSTYDVKDLPHPTINSIYKKMNGVFANA
jgi:hypothetical protein